MPDLFKDIIPSILERKNIVLNNSDDEKSYVPFVVNKAISFHPDCIFLINEMNLAPGLDKRLQYHFLINTIRSWKRPFRKWMKIEELEHIDIVKKYFNVSNSKAKEYLSILTQEQLDLIKEQMSEGGLGNVGRQKGKSKQ